MEPHWDYPVQLWAAQNGYANGGTGIISTSTEPATIPPPSGLVITSPQSGASVSASVPITLEAQEISAPIDDIVYYLNGVDVGQASASPYAISVIPTSHGPTQLRAVAQLVSGQIEEAEVTFNVQ